MLAGFQKGAFQVNAFQIEDVALETVLMPSKTGPAFTRKRWKQIVDAEEAVREAERKAASLKEKKEREIAEAAARAAREAVLAERALQQERWHNAHSLRAVEHSLAAFNSARTIDETMRAAHALIAVARAAHERFEQQDEDEAIALLLLSRFIPCSFNSKPRAVIVSTGESPRVPMWSRTVW